MSPSPSNRKSLCGTRKSARPGRPAALAVLGLMITVLASACNRTDRARRAPGFLQVDIETSPLAIDPRFATDAISSRVGELLFDSLVRVDAQGRFAGDLAETIERPSATAIVFHLRRQARFSDGRPLTARDVKYTYDFVSDPANLSPKRAGLETVKAVRALDDYTIELTTERPYAPALESATYGIVPYGSPGRSGRPPAGSGPFRLVRFVRDESLVLERNPFAPHADSGPRGLTFKIVPDPTVRALELAEGVCDFAENNIEPYLLGYLKARSQIAVVQSPGSAYQYLAFNFRDPHLRDVRVRRAIAYAIDREAIVASMLHGTARVASGMLAPESWAYSGDVTRYPYDPAAAGRLLDEAGYPAGAGGMRPLALVYKTTPEGRRLAEALQAMLRRVGISLSVRSNEFGTFYGDIQRGEFDLTSMQWVGINDPHQYYMVFDSKMTPPNGHNRGWYANPEMDRLVEAGDAMLDPEQRRAIYAKVQKLAADDLPYVSLWWQDTVAVMNRRMAGFEPFPNGSLRSFSNLKLLDAEPNASAGAGLESAQ
jgi:peptide/nickel transport system substrate-binding protein